MRTLIENYRGWEIFFDTDKEDFYTVSNEYDRQENKRSYASTKKFIDDYIKENNGFKPVFVQRMKTHYSDGEVIKLIGIRKDGNFMYEGKDGKKQQMSSYSEKDYFLVDEANDPLFKKIESLIEKRNKIDKEIQFVSSEVSKFTVPQIREKLLK